MLDDCPSRHRIATIRSYVHNMSVELRLKPLETVFYIGFSGQGDHTLSVRMKCVLSFTH